MRVSLPDHLQALEHAVLAFLTDRLPIADDASARTHFIGVLQSRGWSAPCWPLPWGGGLSPGEALIVDRTLGRAGAPVPDPITIDLAGPALLRWSDDTRRRRWLPGMAGGSIRVSVHESLSGAPPLAGGFEGDAFTADQSTARIWNAAQSQALMALAADGEKEALILGWLDSDRISAGLPLDPDVVRLDAMCFEVVTEAASTAELLGSLAGIRRTTPGRSWTGRLRHLIEGLEPADDTDVRALEIQLIGLEVLELRVLTEPSAAARETLAAALSVRGAALARAVLEERIARLGYYALAAPDRSRQHNEMPDPALAAQDAAAELIRYLQTDVTGQRDLLARLLDHGGKG